MLEHRQPTSRRARYPLDVGDSWRPPPAGCHDRDPEAELHRYAPPAGLPALRDALLERARARYGATVGRRNVLVTAGATAGCAAVLASVLRPGEKVLVPAPFWPLIPGTVEACGGVPTIVPFFDRDLDPGAAVERLDRHAGPGTAALYLNLPNNPTGAVLDPATVEAIIAWARRRELWILADRVLEELVFAPAPDAPPDATPAVTPSDIWPLAPERTFEARSFSKSYGMAGDRCGWVLGPAPAMRRVTSRAAQLVYAAPTPAQHAALRALGAAGETWLDDAREQYRAVGREAAARLGVPAPMAGAFLFLDLARQLEGRPLAALLADCARRGLRLAPGPACGPYPTHVRLCYTAAPPEVVLAGVDLLVAILGRPDRPGRPAGREVAAGRGRG